MTTWRDFWDGEPTSLYVNARHRALHDQTVAGDVARIVGRVGTLLDYGCGETTRADILAGTCDSLLLCDAAPSVRQRLSGLYGSQPHIRILAVDEVAALPAGSIDAAVMNSIAQYLSTSDMRDVVHMLHDRLKPGGRLVVGDVLQPEQSALGDALSLLRFGWQGGFAVAAAVGLVRTALSDYRRLRRELGLTAYEENQMLDLLETAGFDARRHQPNIGHNGARMTFVADKPRT